MSLVEDCLFLLEAFVKKIIFVRRPCLDGESKTCITFDFLKIHSLEIICNDDQPNTSSSIMLLNDSYTKNINMGKSFLFTMKENEIEYAKKDFKVNITIYKLMPPGILPARLVIGKCTVDLSRHFTNARNQFLADQLCIGNSSFTESVALKGGEEFIGELCLFMRISSFGKLRVNKSQSDLSTSDAKSSFKESTTEVSKSPVLSSDLLFVENFRHTPANSTSPTISEPFVRTESTVTMTKNKSPVRYCNLDNYNMQQLYTNEVNNRLETVASGKTLKLKVAKNAMVANRSEEACQGRQDFSNNIREVYNAACVKSSGYSSVGNPIIASNKSCTSPVCPLNTGPSQALVPINVPGANETQKKLHPRKDVFVFKVAKTAGQQRKSKLELELVTPKGIERKTPGRLETQSSQCEEKDFKELNRKGGRRSEKKKKK